MEKNIQELNQEISYLKKSLKNKRRAQVWEQCMQYYRNHQSTLNNYQILKIIKIVMKPLKATILGSCKYFSKFSKQKQARAQDKKKSQQIKQFIQILRLKVSALKNLFESYTLVLQAYLNAAEPLYFKMIFRENYHSKISIKQLFFQPTQITIQRKIPEQQIYHQISSYLNFVSISTNLLCTCSLIYQDQQTIITNFKTAQKAVQNIFESSYKFAVRKLQFEILKLNLISVVQSSCDILVEFQHPIDIFNIMYKNYNKWDFTHFKHYYKLLLQYIFISLQNIQKIVASKTGLNIQTQICLVIKQMLIVKKYIPINIKKQFYLRSFQIMNSIVEDYDVKMLEKMKWSNFLTNFFNSIQIKNLCSKIPNSHYKQEQNKVGTDLEIIKKEKSQYRNRNKNKSAITMRSVRIQLKKQKEQKKYQNCYGGSIYEFAAKIKNVFNIVGQSESDQQNYQQHKFQQNRQQNIRKFEVSKLKNKNQQVVAGKSNQNMRQIGKLNKEKILFCDMENVNKNFKDLHLQTNRFRSFSATAIQRLSKRKQTNNIQIIQKLSQVDNVFVQNETKKNICNKNILGQKKIIINNNKKSTFLLPQIDKEKNTHVQKNKSSYSIILSQKYDKMSRMLLLSNTNKQNILNQAN